MYNVCVRDSRTPPHGKPESPPRRSSRRRRFTQSAGQKGAGMRRLTSLSPYVLTALLLVANASEVRSQSFQGGLRGTVKDVNGVIPGAGVTLVNEATNVQRSTISNEVGEYVFAAVLPGTYTVHVALTGFKTFDRKGLTIGTQQFITLDLLME